MPGKILELALILAGSFFLFISALGIWRLDDFFERIHAPTKAATLGLLSLFGATIVALDGVATKAFLAVVFIAASVPVGSHYLARVAHRCGVRPRGEGVRDDYAAYHQREGRRR